MQSATNSSTTTTTTTVLLVLGVASVYSQVDVPDLDKPGDSIPATTAALASTTRIPVATDTTTTTTMAQFLP
ncbi:hypothetical protein M0802_000708 [Mischocyttarus mexicanus]|nr:hypothetical protein M0802_000708 [Mischocyttarus mexicanus]